MEKLDKVIRALEQCHRDIKYRDCDVCGYASAGSECERCLMEDALEVLKEYRLLLQRNRWPCWECEYALMMLNKYRKAIDADCCDLHRDKMCPVLDEEPELRTCYCPLCDKHFEVRSNDSSGDCPDCGHHVVLNKVEVEE